MTIGELIRNARYKQGISQSELAARLKITPQSINQYEHDRRKPKLDTLRKICKALELTSIGELGEDIWKYYGSSEMENDLILAGYEVIIEFKANSDQQEERIDEYSKYFLKSKLLTSFEQLNIIGKEEAIKRVEELTEIKKYTIPNSNPK